MDRTAWTGSFCLRRIPFRPESVLMYIAIKPFLFEFSNKSNTSCSPSCLALPTRVGGAWDAHSWFGTVVFDMNFRFCSWSWCYVHVVQPRLSSSTKHRHQRGQLFGDLRASSVSSCCWEHESACESDTIVKENLLFYNGLACVFIGSRHHQKRNTRLF